MNPNDQVGVDLLNLHDCFLNASLVKKLMEETPLVENPSLFHLSDRARLERLWVGMLAVLIESWRSRRMVPVQNYIKTFTSIDELNSLLRQGGKDGSIDQMIRTRHYMFHRDKREYFDEGRNSPIGNLAYHSKIHNVFGDILLNALKDVKGVTT